MSDDFVCYGTYDDRIKQCLLTCPDRHSCERITRLNRQIAELEKRSEQTVEDAEDAVE